MIQQQLITTLVLLLCCISSMNAFFIPLIKKNNKINYHHHHEQTTTFSSSSLLSSSLAPSDVDDDNYDLSKENDSNSSSSNSSNSNNDNKEQLKNKLLRLCASYDRGFSASPSAKKEVNELVNELTKLNPTPSNAARGIDGVEVSNTDLDVDIVPLKGIWRMVWTTALDVVNLAASPIATPGAIYQVIDPPIATNVIDFIPRVQSLFPDIFPSSLLRAEVKTRTSRRMSSSSSSSSSSSEDIEITNRVGLDFESVKLSPVQVLGINAQTLPPLNINFPQIKVTDLNIPGVDVDASNSPGFFDVVYLDDDMLIIQQNAPGGYFVSIKVPNYDP